MDFIWGGPDYAQEAFNQSFKGYKWRSSSGARGNCAETATATNRKPSSQGSQPINDLIKLVVQLSAVNWRGTNQIAVITRWVQ